ARDLLGSLDDRGATLDGGGAGGGALGVELGATLGGTLAEPVEARTQAGEVADRGGLCEVLREACDRLVDLLDREVGGTEPGLEERDLRLDLEETTHVESHGLLGAHAGELADGTFGLALADIDGAVLV